ncbi:DUF3427 domain-containing protein [Membranihabitans marinus]|uniref:DUF3427 domain-containing protein n=1 Tax=Membranihabitans marinus TaxID=1227546 RepID=UPI001F215F15|nr:DUF3427 domain-containing protein [Membranihabitans marinus]
MKDSLIEEFEKSLATGFIDKTSLSTLEYQPKLLINRKKPPTKVLSTILQELNTCESFYISVAFVTTSGVATIINTLKELEFRQIQGKILVSQYLNFTQPEALKRLRKFSNIELRIATTENAHNKCYIFKKSDHYNLIIGSSNLTASALATNKEWNLKVSALRDSSISHKVIQEFETDFDKARPVTLSFLSEYEKIYHKQRLIHRENSLSTNPENTIRANSMQLEALKNLSILRSQNKTKALIISATGTGKTFLSAFDAKAFQAKKLLFVVHRQNIAKKSMETFQQIFGHQRTMGLYSGSQREIDNDFIFSTVQTISKPHHYSNFAVDHFDYIVIDESHRSGADSYLKILDYFQPKFLLGMTATPERTDGYDIFSLFDHNIAYEIRLSRAMEEDMLSQFHYYGVTDLSVDEVDLENTEDFNRLSNNERLNHIVSTAEFYGTDNGIVRGLVFCSRIEEAKSLSENFNQLGYKTLALSGENSENERTSAIDRLESDDLAKKLDYIFTVDIFNEGVDIPKVNQILLIRPTESAIVFIQQLGRGLRKVEGKGYLTIIDFIGNYKNNYLIPIALYGDHSYNKDKLRNLLSNGSRMIPGASTINFDEITKKKIYESINAANLQLLSDLKKDYLLLKYKLGRIPMMMDFIHLGSRDPYLFVKYSQSYFNFVCKVDQTSSLELPSKAIKLLELFSLEINNGKRVEESIILQQLILTGKLDAETLNRQLTKNYDYSISNDTIESCVNNLNFRFTRQKKNGKLKPAGIIHEIEVIRFRNDHFELTPAFQIQLENPTFKAFLLDSIDYGLHRFNQEFAPQKWDNGFLLYHKYSRKDVFRILNFEVNPVAQNVGGYMISPDLKNCPIFVNYHKEDHISESTKYADEFINNREFDWMSKSNRRLQSDDVQAILGKKGSIRLPLFIKKNNDEGIDFYFMGDISPQPGRELETTIQNDSGKSIPVVKIRFNLSRPVSNAMYQYITDHQTSQDVISPPQPSVDESVDSKQDNTIKIPLYNFYAAAGSFSEMQAEKDFTTIEIPQPRNQQDEYFSCKVIGESMNRVIPNGSICLFKKYNGGIRSGKIVLIEQGDYHDTDFKSSFTVKTYSEEYSSNNQVNIVLRPHSHDRQYQNLSINRDQAKNMKILGEFIKVIKHP